MNTSWKIFRSTTLATAKAALFLLTASAGPAQEAAKEKRVALRTAGGKYLSTAANGGFDLDSQSVKEKSVFIMIDSNGGNLADGDEVKIKYMPGQSADSGKSKPSYWIEEAGKVKRVNAELQSSAGTFKLKKQGVGFVLQTAGGKFIAGLDDGGLTLADTTRSVLIFTIEEQPTLQ